MRCQKVSIPVIAITAAILTTGCVSKHTAVEINAMSGAELRAHWDEVQYAMPDPGEAYFYRVRSAGVNRFGQDWPEIERLWVIERRIWQGMTAEQLYWSWGKPDQRFTDQYPPFTYEHWYWDVSRWTTGREATLQDGQVVWFRIGSVER